MLQTRSDSQNLLAIESDLSVGEKSPLHSFTFRGGGFDGYRERANHGPTGQTECKCREGTLPSRKHRIKAPRQLEVF